jgi:ABC-type multidrug transport system permease subunit
MNIGSAVFAGLMLAVGLVYESMALSMPRGSFAYPGPGLFPMIIGAFMIAMALGCLLQEIVPRMREKEPEASSLPSADAADSEERNVAKTFQLTALLIGYILVLKPLGFPIAICAFLAVAIRIFGYRKWLPTLAMAAIITVVSYVSFVIWLAVPLPMGILEDVLG